MKYIVYLLLAMCIVSCTTKEDLSDADLNTLTGNAVMEYWKTKDTRPLQKVYDTLKYNKEFREQGLTKNNYVTLYPVFFNLKKFDELDKLLGKDIGINEYTKLNARNIVRFYANRNKNSEKAKSALQDNLHRIKDTLGKSPKDSLLYLDYFTNRRMMAGTEQTLKEIDSMEAVNHNYSELFYDAVLRDVIKSYPDDL